MSEALSLHLDWTVAKLRLLKTMSRNGATLAQMAARFGVTKTECDRALWKMVGRTPEAAALHLKDLR
jgi:hypothetical protein